MKTNLVREQAALTPGKVAFLGGAPAFLALLAFPAGVSRPCARAGRWRRKSWGAWR